MTFALGWQPTIMTTMRFVISIAKSLLVFGLLVVGLERVADYVDAYAVRSARNQFSKAVALNGATINGMRRPPTPESHPA